MKTLLLLCLVGGTFALPVFEERDVNENCGKSKVPLNRIIGGTTAQKGQYPWMVSIRFNSGVSTWKHYCGGSIIDDQWIVTAAHCLKNPTATYRVRVGTFNQSAGASEPEAQEFPVEKYIIYDTYGTKGLAWDIGLVKIAGKVDFTSPYINRVCLPPSGKYSTDGKSLTVIGWGNTITTGTKNPDLLQQTQLMGLPDATCKSNWGNSWMDEVMLCAVNTKEWTSSCNGDSGGPMTMIDETGRANLVGAVSFGESKCAGPRPPVFTRVSYFVDWIIKTMKTN